MYIYIYIKERMTPLLVASSYGYIDVVTALLSNSNIDVNVQDKVIIILDIFIFIIFNRKL